MIVKASNCLMYLSWHPISEHQAIATPNTSVLQASSLSAHWRVASVTSLQTSGFLSIRQPINLYVGCLQASSQMSVSVLRASPRRVNCAPRASLTSASAWCRLQGDAVQLLARVHTVLLLDDSGSMTEPGHMTWGNR